MKLVCSRKRQKASMAEHSESKEQQCERSTENSEWGQTSYALYNRQAPLTQNQLFLFYPRQTLGGHGNPLQYSCPENFMDGDWQATVHGVTKSWTDWTHLHAKTESLNSKTETLSFPFQVVIKYKYTPYKVLWIYLYFYHKEVKITFLLLIVLRLFEELKETRTSQRYRCFFPPPAALCSTQDLSSPTRNGTHAPCTGSKV